MTRKEAENRLQNLYDQLELIHEYEREFLQIDGVRGLERRVDAILDEINRLSKFLKFEKMNHDLFWDVYNVQTSDTVKKNMMKDYMLNLSSADLDSFIFDNLRAIRTYVETTDLSDKERLSIAADLDKAKALLQRPIKQAA